MTGWPAEPVRKRRTLEHPSRGGQRHVDGRARRRIRALHDRGGGVEAVSAEPVEARKRSPARLVPGRERLGGEGIGDERAPPIVACGQGIGPDVLQEVDQVGVMHGGDGCRAVLDGWLERIAFGGAQSALDLDGAGRRLVARHWCAADELDQPIVGEVRVGGDDRGGHGRAPADRIPGVNENSQRRRIVPEGDP